jgi:uncharacterized Zn finger protein
MTMRDCPNCQAKESLIIRYETDEDLPPDTADEYLECDTCGVMFSMQPYEFEDDEERS